VDLQHLILSPAGTRCAVAGLLALCLAACGGPADAPEQDFVVPTPLEIEITGSKFQWKIHYPGADGRLGTDDDAFGERELHLPKDAEALIHLRSKDYVYSFALPHLGLREIAVPELEFSLAFPARESGTFELRGDQLCGFAHPKLIGKVLVQSPEDYAAEMRRLRVH